MTALRTGDEPVPQRPRGTDWRATTVVARLLPFAVMGCMKTQEGRIYSMSDGRNAALVAEHPLSSGGELRTALPTGESCSGRFSEVDVDEAVRLGVGDVPLSANSEAGLAVLFCGSGRVLHCTLARRENERFSYGACTDPHGNEFSLIF